MDVLGAYQLAAQLHTGQVDKAGRPYIEHLTRVMLRVQANGGNPPQLIAALLHDSIEDGKASAEQLVRLGVPDAALVLILVLTKGKGQGYENYLSSVRGNQRALLVKFADLDDNGDPARLAVLPVDVAERLRKKYESARQFLAMA